MSISAWKQLAKRIPPKSIQPILINKDLRDSVDEGLVLAGFQLSVREPSRRIYQNAQQSRIEVVMA